MRYWTFFISKDSGLPDTGAGWIRANSADEALALVRHDDACVVETPDDTGFPPEATGAIYWTLGSPADFSRARAR